MDDGFEDNILALQNYSFISVNMDSTTFEMHRLVQLATQKWLKASKQKKQWKQQFIAKSKDLNCLWKFDYINHVKSLISIWALTSVPRLLVAPVLGMPFLSSESSYRQCTGCLLQSPHYLGTVRAVYTVLICNL